MLVNVDSPKSNETFETFLSEFFFSQDYEYCENLFRDLLKSCIGGDKSCGTHSHEEISDALYSINDIHRFIRTLKPYLNKDFITSDTQLSLLVNLYNGIDYELLEETIFKAFHIWIIDSYSEQACLSYAHKAANRLMAAAELLKACSEINKENESTMEKGGSSC